MTQEPIEFRTAPSVVEPDAAGQAALLLTESMIHMLVENGIMTSAQAADIVHSAAMVKVEVTEAAGESQGNQNPAYESRELCYRAWNTAFKYEMTAAVPALSLTIPRPRVRRFCLSSLA